MKIEKTLKWLMAVSVVVGVVGCDSSDSGNSSTQDGSEAGLNMADFSEVDQEKLVQEVTSKLIGTAYRCDAFKVEKIENKQMKLNTKKVEEGLESGPCAYGGSKNVIANEEIEDYGDGYTYVTKLEVSYDHCKDSDPGDNSTFTGIDGYMKEYYTFTNNEHTELNVYKDGYREMDDYICTKDYVNGTATEVSTTIKEAKYITDYYKYSVDGKVLKQVDDPYSTRIEESIHNISGYRTYGFAEGYVYVEANAIMHRASQKGCRTDGVIHLTGKNNTKITIQYNADRTLDFTLNGKTEHWYSCNQKNP